MSNENLDYNKLICGFKGSVVPEEFLIDLASDNLLVKYAKDARLFLQGTPADNLMLIASGVVKIYCPHPNGRSFMLGLAGRGQLIGYADFVDSRGRFCEAFEAQALSNCAVALISRQRIERSLAGLNPAVLIRLLEGANTFWTSMVYRCASLMGMSYRERLEAVIWEVAQSLGIKDASGILLTPELGHDDWAALIASSRSLASKLISEMIDEGILKRDGRRYTVLNDAVFKEHSYALTDRQQRTEFKNGFHVRGDAGKELGGVAFNNSNGFQVSGASHGVAYRK